MFVIIWEFEAAPERIEEFLSIYSPQGEWAQLFARASGYLGTELLQFSEASHPTPTRFLTLDRWAHEDHFTAFQHAFAHPYAALDARCNGLTLSERKLGAFTTPSRHYTPAGCPVQAFLWLGRGR
jgi:heme-degrading monooxygenase HmoA